MARQVRVQVKPGSRRGPAVETLDPSADAELLVHVRERPIEGQANVAIEKVLAAHFDVPKSRVRVTRGHKARIKTVEIDD